MKQLGLVLRLFLRSARLQRKRALLTIAAIAWGTVSILLLLAFGEGLKQQLVRNSRAMGENLAVMWMGETSKPHAGLPPGRPVRLRAEDVEAARARLPELKAVWGEIVEWRTPMSFGAKVINGRVLGTNVAYGEARKHYPQPGGRFLNVRDLAEKRRVIFLGDEMAGELFGAVDPVGRTLLLKGAPFTVVGVMQPKVQMGMYGGPDADHAVIPITTFHALYGRDRLTVLGFQVSDPEQMDTSLRQVNELMGARHGFDPGDDSALPTWNTARSQRSTAQMMAGIQLFLGLVGALTLVVGSVGVANIMYAVVKERTREIGVKMALGARSLWITGPLVLEGLVYTCLGGTTGLAIAAAIVGLLGLIPLDASEVLEFLGHPTLSLPIGAATAAILGTCGALAGYFPARRAAAIDPAETLRHD